MAILALIFCFNSRDYHLSPLFRKDRCSDSELNSRLNEACARVVRRIEIEINPKGY
jgi:hypothetical protein